MIKLNSMTQRLRDKRNAEIDAAIAANIACSTFKYDTKQNTARVAAHNNTI